MLGAPNAEPVVVAGLEANKPVVAVAPNTEVVAVDAADPPNAGADVVVAPPNTGADVVVVAPSKADAVVFPPNSEGAVDVEPIASKVKHSLTKVYADKSLKVSGFVGENTVFNGDEGDLYELLGNLMENACKWAQGQVECRSESRHDSGDLRSSLTQLDAANDDHEYLRTTHRFFGTGDPRLLMS